MVRDSEQSLTILYVNPLSGKDPSGERQRAVSDNSLDHSAIREGPMWGETASSQ